MIGDDLMAAGCEWVCADGRRWSTAQAVVRASASTQAGVQSNSSVERHTRKDVNSFSSYICFATPRLANNSVIDEELKSQGCDYICEDEDGHNRRLSDAETVVGNFSGIAVEGGA
jgi:hypothetical protein